MTGENRKENLAIEVEKADASLRAADLCLHAGLFDDAVSRAYYAAFHMVQAVLLTLGLESRTLSVRSSSPASSRTGGYRGRGNS